MEYDDYNGSLQTSTTASNASGGCYGDIHRTRDAVYRNDSKLLLVTGTEDGWLVVWDASDSSLPVEQEINVDGSNNNRITDISFTPYGRAFVNTEGGGTYAIDISDGTEVWKRTDISTENERQIGSFSRRTGGQSYGNWFANRLSGTCTKGGSGVKGAVVMAVTESTQRFETGVVGYAETDSNGDWKMTVMMGEDKYHIIAQYDDGSDKHNAKSYPYIPNEP